ncbi:hypothetical protein OJ997_24585 [Solirubrobacter phytolaccae]|uniref:Uncharacterized protein n=1 Tax=Solirubrobacter phytolaccae TaxID=1404360 RepID=A0A9X3NCB7_9ACTN|nr:hypothetical protein [Solirubrobacter phytolaccae]MDA0183509.1 hypothetical protein [Solirubrobacter phytolaccae]
MADPETEELQLEQLQREHAEREQAKDADLPREERTHERRADRAAYLQEKLEERARSEDAADG